MGMAHSKEVKTLTERVKCVKVFMSAWCHAKAGWFKRWLISKGNPN